MSARYYIYFLVGCLLLGLGSCIEPYRPDIIQAPNNYLVVDGFINSNGITTIRLSRTVNLDGAAVPPGETKAKVYIEEEGGPQYGLSEGRDGNYTSQPLQLNLTRRYRLRIRTANNKEYASAYVANKITPPIDSISWKAADDALQIYVSSHDPKQDTRYYRWNYEETWEFTTPFYSANEYVNNNMIDRRDNINRCWRGGVSSAIFIASTAKLSQDVVSEFPLVKLPASSFKIKYKYSLLVKQYAQTLEAYNYAETLKKNTENIGTLFDPLPTQLTGNIQCISDPGEPVIGFVSVSSVQEKRFFINREQLPPTWISQDEYASCKLDTVLNKDIPTVFKSGQTLPIQQIMDMGRAIGYSASTADCVDCRLRGTNVKPDFWE